EDKEKKKEPVEKEEKEGQGSGEGDDEEDEDEQEEEPGEGESSDRKDEKEDHDADEKTTSDKKTVAEDIAAAPSVRRMAREAGVDLSEIEGTGPGNRITVEDIASAKKGKDDQSADGEKKKTDAGSQAKEGTLKREKAIELPDFSQWGETKKEKMNTVRRITARTMTASWQQIPQVTQFDEADITDIEAFRQRNKDDYDKKGGKLTVTAILMKISAFALQKFPRFNSSLDTSDNTLVMKQYINIGIAVDTDKGLIVPVIKDTDKKSLEKISVETVELAKKARESEISPEELQGGNFTISNLGGIGGTGFTPIVYAPQVAILGVSRASYRQVFREDRFQQRLILPISLTYDHRVIDGAEGARFLRWICEVLEDPYALLQ
ncbi:MAG: 2-oxo acid dehydrogenase subunit E2, partial [Bacteroidales bacterium]|nr:2-oxo acid dehydrogenase subunit E2 [Bacteroidales bacterium]